MSRGIFQLRLGARRIFVLGIQPHCLNGPRFTRQRKEAVDGSWRGPLAVLALTEALLKIDWRS
jgi:hypothetical protein